MSDTIVSTPLGESLRQIADLVDQVPALEGARTVPSVPQSIMVGVRTSLVARALAKDFGVEATESVDVEHNTVHTHFSVDRGTATLHVFAIEDLPRELRRPVDATESIEAFAERVGITTFQAGADL